MPISVPNYSHRSDRHRSESAVAESSSYLKLRKDIVRPTFGVNIAVCIAVNSPALSHNNAAITDDLYNSPRRWVVSCHAKGFAWLPEMNVHYIKLISGRGEIDDQPYLRAIRRYAPQAPLMLEHLKTAEECLEGATYIRNKMSAAARVLLFS